MPNYTIRIYTWNPAGKNNSITASNTPWPHQLLVCICPLDGAYFNYLKCSYMYMVIIRWNKNVVILTKFSLLAPPKVVILATFGAASDEDLVKMKTFPFQWYWVYGPEPRSSGGIISSKPHTGFGSYSSTCIKYISWKGWFIHAHTVKATCYCRYFKHGYFLIKIWHTLPFDIFLCTAF